MSGFNPPLSVWFLWNFIQSLNINCLGNITFRQHKKIHNSFVTFFLKNKYQLALLMIIAFISSYEAKNQLLIKQLRSIIYNWRCFAIKRTKTFFSRKLHWQCLIYFLLISIHFGTVSKYLNNKNKIQKWIEFQSLRHAIQ